ncbi:Uncharacterised protein [Segatella copri]|nr:Uncharacterised protein [Segatella copri]
MRICASHAFPLKGIITALLHRNHRICHYLRIVMYLHDVPQLYNRHLHAKKILH